MPVVTANTTTDRTIAEGSIWTAFPLRGKAVQLMPNRYSAAGCRR
jgi:hypothetical protein